MLVRVGQRAPLIRVVTVAALAIVFLPPRSADAQEAPQMPASHTVKRGDTLWDLAKLYLGDSFLWPEIYRLNTDVIEDPHWIYPGEVLKLPAPARVVAVTPPQPRDTVVPVAPRPVTQTPEPVRAEPAPVQAVSSVRVGEYAAAPWVDQVGGPRGSGYIMQGYDLPGIATKDQSRMNLYDRVVLSPPVGSVAPERDLYLSYKLGPDIDGFGQIVIPTGIIQIVRSPRNGEAAVGRVVKMFGEVLQGHRLIPYDSSAALVAGRPVDVTGTAPRGTIRWILSEPVLPSLQHYIVVDISRREGLTTGDVIELYQPRSGPAEGETLAIPEVWIARAQVMRVTQQGASAIIINQEQPKIHPGTHTRVSAKMP